MDKRLYRSRTDAKLAGICAGLGQYFGIDPTLVRVFMVLLALANGIGVMIYLVLWLIMPYADQPAASAQETVQTGADEIAGKAREFADDVQAAVRRSNLQPQMLAGAALVVLGLVFLIDNLNLPWLRWVHFGTLWPILLIAAGVALLWRRSRGD